MSIWGTGNMQAEFSADDILGEIWKTSPSEALQAEVRPTWSGEGLLLCLATKLGSWEVWVSPQSADQGEVRQKDIQYLIYISEVSWCWSDNGWDLSRFVGCFLLYRLGFANNMYVAIRSFSELSTATCVLVIICFSRFFPLRTCLSSVYSQIYAPLIDWLLIHTSICHQLRPVHEGDYKTYVLGENPYGVTKSLARHWGSVG